MSAARYAELQMHLAFLVPARRELLRGAVRRRPPQLGIEALAIVDRNSLAGIVRAHEAAKVTGVRLIVGCRLDLADGIVDAGLSDRPARLFAALPPAVARQEARRQGASAISTGRMSSPTAKA